MINKKQKRPLERTPPDSNVDLYLYYRSSTRQNILSKLQKKDDNLDTFPHSCQIILIIPYSLWKTLQPETWTQNVQKEHDATKGFTRLKM